MEPYNNAMWSKIPEGSRGGLRRYMEHRIEPGHFLMAVLSNDLYGAVARADDTNQAALVDYVKWLCNYADSRSWGSRERVKDWLNYDSSRT